MDERLLKVPEVVIRLRMSRCLEGASFSSFADRRTCIVPLLMPRPKIDRLRSAIFGVEQLG